MRASIEKQSVETEDTEECLHSKGVGGFHRIVAKATMSSPWGCECFSMRYQKAIQKNNGAEECFEIHCGEKVRGGKADECKTGTERGGTDRGIRRI